MSPYARKALTALVLTLLCTSLLAAQNATLRGQVRDEALRPVTGVTVQVPGTQHGAITNQQGQYTFTLPAGTYEVEAQSIGYGAVRQSVTLAAGETATLNFELSAEAVQLNEVLVSLSATNARRAEVGTDIERLDATEAVDRGAVGTVSDLLTGRATGVTVSQSSGSVGGASQIRIRGSTSLTQDNNPIIDIDGIRVSNQTGTGPGSYDFGNGQTISRLDDLNPQDIASVQVMKGPTAAALYGSEAAAGVLLIETKKGAVGSHQLSVNIQEGILQDVADYPDNYFNLTAAGFDDPNDPLIQQFRPVVDPATGDIYARHNPLENPLTSPLRTGHSSQYTASLSGGAQSLRYFGSLQYENQTGTLPNNELERYSFRANLETTPTEGLTISLNNSFIGSTIRLPDNDRSAVGMITNAGAGLPIFSRGTLPDGSAGDCLATVVAGTSENACDVRRGNLSASFDKLATIENTQDLGRMISGLQARWTPFDWFANRIAVGIDFIQTKNRNSVPLDPDRPFGPDSDGLINDSRVTDRTLTLDYAGTVTFEPTPSLRSSTTVGVQYFNSDTELVACEGSGGFASNTANACDAALIFSGRSDKIQNIEVGALFQQQLAYNDYLFGTGGIRVDDNSAFGENQGGIWSPSFNVSAVLSSMPFWRLDPERVSDFRVRAAWGTAAQAPNPFAHARTLRPVRLTDADGTQRTGVSLLDPGNPDLTAERNEEWEVGFDSNFFGERLNTKFTYFSQKTTDAIVQTRVAPSSGFSGPRYVNLGAIENNGIEFLAGVQLLRRGDFRWEVEAKLSTQDPVITDLGGQPPILFGLSADHQMFREGFAPGAYFGRVVTSAERDADGAIIPGSIVFAEQTVGDPSATNHVYLGRSQPSNQQSLSTTFTLFQNFRLYAQFDRAGGFQKMNMSESFRSPFIANSSGSRRFAFRKAESSPEEQAMMELGGNARTSVFVEDATFVKWRELTLSYSVPDAVARRWVGGSGANVTLGARNLYTWTGYSGLDPELRYDGGRDSFNAAEFFTQPPGRSLFLRVGLTL